MHDRQKMDKSGIEPETFRMRSGRDNQLHYMPNITAFTTVECLINSVSTQKFFFFSNFGVKITNFKLKIYIRIIKINERFM